MLRVFLSIAFAIVLIALYIKYIESKSVFFPAKNIESYPHDIGISFEDVYVTTADNIRLNGWFVPSESTTYTILFLHGNGGNISHRLEKLKMLLDCKTNVFLVDYRGYGKSEGHPSERKVYSDAQTFYDYLIQEKHTPPDKIIIYGESLGTAVAIDVASRNRIKGIILEGAFSSGKDMARKIYPFIPRFFFSNIFDSMSKIKKVKAKKLFIHSKNDEIVPYDLARKLYENALQPKIFVDIIGGHNTAFIDSQDKYISSIKEFIANL